ncbi:hypothetical protein Sn250709_122 [Synechococcus phage S-RIM2]|jgi:hypothetical protein|uniref:Gp130 n=4 Tax=Nerrivikvirus srim2 TaxID=2734125 RepID=A0A1D7RGY4_9CAUD|nr:hypothetical protein SWTG_00093 [Synechococcus phage S-RIM2 R1_1999]AGH06803.1 hypothetical protein SWRG_00109 [Synechococcus phage S-RIM2 R21_2007]AGH07013.1 hypothetical protein SWUG_00104 [Synechococcus phage S-RIM2 R9_2006]AON97635.1 hypothetical protein Fa020709_122 [Synechococcus phage S-RIM2]AGH07224.1 hypothetical protein SWTG_00093 [Synechococcus phage S-RIM2 R1_1999]AON98063.1 hypothetical protein Fa240709_122 [Synechococcus phage S-RIM2]
MPSDIAKQIVQQVYSDEKAAAIDSMNDALASATYDAIQKQKIAFAQQMGFDLNDTGQDAADEVAAELPDNLDSEVVEVPAPEATAEEQPEQPETDETDS